MRATEIDERDSRWRDEPSGYRVFFWRPLGPLGPRELHLGVPYESSVYELSGARDVEEALAWARANADGRTFTLYAALDRDSAHGLIRLSGFHVTSGGVSNRQAEEVRRLFSDHGHAQEPLMHPVTSVDERVFVVTPEQLAAMSAVDELVGALERVLEAPVRIETE